MWEKMYNHSLSCLQKSKMEGDFMFLEVEDYLFDCQSRGLSPFTLKNYRNHLIAFERYIRKHGINDVRAIKPLHIKKYIKSKQDKGLTNKYCNAIYKVLKTFFDYCIENEYIIQNPMKNISLIREEKKIKPTFTDKEVNRLLNCYDFSDYLNARNKAIIHMMLDTGIRTIEVIRMMNEDVQSDRIKIRGKGAKERFVPVSIELRKVLRRYEKIKENYFYGKEEEPYYFLSRTNRQLTNSAVENIFRKARELCNIENCTPYWCRHYFATKMMENNDIYTVSKFLGHSNVRITENYISTLTDEKLIEQGKIISPLTTLKKGGRK